MNKRLKNEVKHNKQKLIVVRLLHIDVQWLNLLYWSDCSFEDERAEVGVDFFGEGAWNIQAAWKEMKNFPEIS